MKKAILLNTEFMADKKVSDLIYGYLQTISYAVKSEDGVVDNIVYKSDATPTKIHTYLTEKGAEVSLSTVKNNLKLFKALFFIKEGQEKDKFGKKKSVYYLDTFNEGFTYQLVNKDTLQFLVDATNANVIKIYAYLLNKYEWKNKSNEMYSFTKGELAEAIGYSIRGKQEVYDMITNILTNLVNNGLIEFVQYYEKNFEEQPVPRFRLTKVNQEYKRL